MSGGIFLHQSKKEVLARQWNQKVSLDLCDQIEIDEAKMNEMTRDIGKDTSSRLHRHS